MSDVAGAASAAADSAPAPVDGAPINENPAGFNAPLGSQLPQPDAPTVPEKGGTLDDAMERAIARSNAKQAEAKPDLKADAKPESKPEAKAAPKDTKPEPAKPAPLKDEATGKFVSSSPKPAEATKPAEVKPSHTAEDAPAWLKAHEKPMWATLAPEAKAVLERRNQEAAQGVEKHRERAEKWDALKEFDEIATRSGTTVKDALARYVGMENKIREDLLGGVDAIIQNATNGKYSLRDIAAHVSGQKPEEAQAQSDATIRELRATVQQLQQQVGGVVQNINTQREQSTLTEINKFAADHPRFEELADDIALFMKSGRAKDLPAAYEMAERLNPAPAKAAEPAASAAAIAPDPSAQPDKGQKSITGAPSSGLNSQAKKRVAKSLDESLDHAFGAVG